jgi:hypothetical protein
LRYRAILEGKRFWGQSFQIDFLICQLEDINPKGLTLIMSAVWPAAVEREVCVIGRF